MSEEDATTAEKLAPALSREEWERVTKDDVRIMLEFPADDDLPDERIVLATEWAPDVIALANHGLPDSDPRKITRDWIDLLNRVAAGERLDATDVRALDAFAEALESYLPPGT